MSAKICAFFLIFLSVTGATIQAENAAGLHLSFTTSLSKPYFSPDGKGFYNLIIAEVFTRLGRRGTLNHLPGERALVNLNDGLEDGHLARVGGLTRIYPEIVQGRESVVSADFVAFTRKKGIRLSGWNSLENYNVAFINGWKILEKNVRKARTITKVDNLQQLFRMLRDERADVVLTLRWLGLQKVRDLGLSGVRVIEPPFAQVDTYFYFPKRNVSLAPLVDGALKAMKRDGSYQRLFKVSFDPLRTPGSQSEDR